MNMLDFIAYPLGKFLLFIYNTVAFNNYGLAIIFFTILVKLALLPLTLKQYKSSAKMQELQPIISDIQKRYKDDKEKLNQEMMKVYQENNYNPASGCLPLLVQMPILITLYWVIVQPLKFMLGKAPETINTLIEVARKGLNIETLQAMGSHKELITLNFFNENREALSQVTGLLERSELIDFNNFLGLHLGEVAQYNPSILFGDKAGVYIPLFLLAILATVTTFISTKLSMPKQNQNGGSQQSAMGSGMSNTMMYIGPIMTLMFSFQLPAGVVLYWMIGYVFAIGQQLYINKYVLKKNVKPEQKSINEKKAQNGNKSLETGNDNAGALTAGDQNNSDSATNGSDAAYSGNKNNAGSGNKGSNKGGSNQKKGKKKK